MAFVPWQVPQDIDNGVKTLAEQLYDETGVKHSKAGDTMRYMLAMTKAARAAGIVPQAGNGKHQQAQQVPA